MKITLISPYPDITNFGIRTISSFLKRNGHKTKIIILPDPYGDNLVFNTQRYDDNVLDEVVSLCKGSNLIGITLMTNFFDGAVQITKKIKGSIDVPIIWGGVHPTIRPEESLKYADMVCISDGEEAMLELATKMENNENYSNIKGLWIKFNEKIIKTPLSYFNRNLDSYPIPDYSMDDHHIMLDGHMIPLTHEITKFYLELHNPFLDYSVKKVCYQTMTGRGCPHKCTYCINDTYKDLHKGEANLRWRSTHHVMEELMWVKEHMPYINMIVLSDDVFFARSQKNLEEFCNEYKTKIGMPFSCLASPLAFTEEKMAILVDAGLIWIKMGVQSGSSRIQELFNRKNMSNEKMLHAMRIINKYKDRLLPPDYDFILDVPYETDEDKVESLRFISEIPKPFRLQPYSLVLYPETKLYHMAKKDGLIVDEKSQVYSKDYNVREPNYFNLLITLSKKGKFPSLLLKFLISKPVIKIFNSKIMKGSFKYIYRGLQDLSHLMKKGYERETIT